MAKVETEISVNASPEACYRIARDMERYPDFMPNVDRITVTESGDDWTITEWLCRLRGHRVKWTERDDFDDDELTIRFDQVKGDLKEFRGIWTFQPDNGGCRIRLVVNVSLGVPMLSAAVDPIVRKATRDNCVSMLEAIAHEAEAGSES